ncbi:hypothetical protein J6590_091529 [Homalodisca vitripennis]|nr:hypothetical protein J6590_091529 [Homalodisca vitripennis]
MARTTATVSGLLRVPIIETDGGLGAGGETVERTQFSEPHVRQRIIEKNQFSATPQSAIVDSLALPTCLGVKWSVGLRLGEKQFSAPRVRQSIIEKNQFSASPQSAIVDSLALRTSLSWAVEENEYIESYLLLVTLK